MINKEEKIIIAVAEPSLLEGGADKIYPCMTRQEAIKRIVKAFCQYTFNRTCEDCPLDDLDCEDVWEHYGFIGGSTEAYNALLKK